MNFALIAPMYYRINASVHDKVQTHREDLDQKEVGHRYPANTRPLIQLKAVMDVPEY